MPTFEQALEQACIEVWTLKDRMEDLKKDDPRVDHRMARYRVTEAANVYDGAIRVLGVLLQMDGQIGVELGSPANPDHRQINQVNQKQDQLNTQNAEQEQQLQATGVRASERIIVTYPSKGLAAAHMGKDFEPIDPGKLPAGRAEPGFWPVGYRPV